MVSFAFTMAISRTTQKQLSQGNFDSLEDDWLAAIAEDPHDLDYFVGVARALMGFDEEERARFLLDMLDSELRDHGHWRTRLGLLERAGSLLLDPEAEDVHDEILRTLGEIYSDRPNFEALTHAVRLHKATHDIPKTWEKVRRLEDLIVFDVGTVVLMENRGVGRVTELNRELDSFKVDFARFSSLTVGFRAAPKLLTPLEPDHVLHRKLEEPKALTELAESDPSEMLRIVLESWDRPLAAGEIRQALEGIVEEKGWSSWWSRARKHPQVMTHGKGGKQTYEWVASDEHAQEAVWSKFEQAEPRRQIELLKREGGRDEDLTRRMTDRLATTAEAVLESEPGLSFEIWHALERAGHAPEEAPWHPRTLVKTVPPRTLLSQVEDRSQREEGYRLLREEREDWQEAYLDLFAREEEAKALDVLARGLRDEAPKDLDRIVDDLLAQPQKQPAAFYWLVDRAADDDDLRTRNPLRLLQQILAMPLLDEFAPWRARFPAMVESGGTVPRLLPHLTEDQAAQAETLIKKAGTLEGYQRQELVNALHLRYPGLDKKKEEDEAFYATRESIEEKRRELKTLLSEELPANRTAIQEAREMGDLRENFEYKAARQRHEYLSDRAQKLENDLHRVQLIGTVPDEVDEVRIGTTVRLSSGGAEPGDARMEFTILGPWESNPESGVLSHKSELAKRLLGKKVGEPVQVGQAPMVVAEILPWSSS